ncbi:MAG TPA: TetR/AcrR family transcriptional regulator [Phototrophicaceae bacterium]|nr:TetR/AcrR family transcriptional regulator [Phototrophicaceae bacterium]
MSNSSKTSQTGVIGESRTERKKRATQEKIQTAAIGLFKKHGFEQTTMEQIAEEADIAKGTLYNHFPVKDAILSAYVQQSFSDQQADRIERLRQLPDTQARLRVILTEIMNRVQVQSDIFEIYLAYRIRTVVSLRPPDNVGGKSGIDRLAIEIIELGQQSGEIRTDLPVAMLADLFEFVFVEVAKPFYASPETYQADEWITHGVDLFINGVKAKTSG